MEEATDPEGTTLEELVEGTTLFLWKTMFPKEHFPGADMIMRAETNSVVALLWEFRVHLGEGRSLVPREIQPTMDEIQQLMLHEQSSFERCQDWIIQAQNYSIQAREATDAAIDRYFKGLRRELIAKVTKMDQQLVRSFVGNWYDRLGTKLTDAQPPPDNKDNIRSWLRKCRAKINQTWTSVFDPHHTEMPSQETAAGRQRRSAGAIVAGAGIVLDLGFQVYNAYELHSLKKKVEKLKNIVSTIASEEVVLHDIPALV